MEFVPPKLYYFFICKSYCIDNYEMANVLTCLAVYWQTYIIQLYKHKNLKGSGSQSVVNWSTLIIWAQNIQVDCSLSLQTFQQYKTTRKRLVHQTYFKHPFVFLINIISEKIYAKYKKQPNLIKTIETKNPINYF